MVATFILKIQQSNPISKLYNHDYVTSVSPYV